MLNINHIYYIPGLKGLYGVLHATHAGIIVSCIQTRKRVTVFNSKKIGCLAAMTIETKSGKILLIDVFYKMKASGKTIAANAEQQDLKNYFQSILPDFDEKLIHASDIVRMVKWFAILDTVVDFSSIDQTD